MARHDGRALLAQSAIDRLKFAAHELVLDNESHRARQKPDVHEEPLDPGQPNAHVLS
jgi:hypothetical protein